MIHVYDTVIDPYQTKVQRYGSTYTLENRSRMGDQVFYTFKNPNRESLLYVPRFAEQYREVEKFCVKHSYCAKFENCKAYIRQEISRYMTVDDMPNQDSSTGVMQLVTAVYKDIKVEFNYMNKHLTLSPTFEIVSNNLFGNGVVVTMNINMEV